MGNIGQKMSPVSPVVKVKMLLALLVPRLLLANMRMLYVEGLISMMVASVWFGLKSTTVFLTSHEPVIVGTEVNFALDKQKSKYLLYKYCLSNFTGYTKSYHSRLYTQENIRKWGHLRHTQESRIEKLCCLEPPSTQQRGDLEELTKTQVAKNIYSD